jgi:hypothetical protein
MLHILLQLQIGVNFTVSGFTKFHAELKSKQETFLSPHCMNTILSIVTELTNSSKNYTFEKTIRSSNLADPAQA